VAENRVRDLLSADHETENFHVRNMWTGLVAVKRLISFSSLDRQLLLEYHIIKSFAQIQSCVGVRKGEPDSCSLAMQV